MTRQLVNTTRQFSTIFAVLVLQIFNIHFILLVTGRFAHFPVRPELFRPESFRPRVVSPSITWVISPSYPESFRPLLDESFRPLSKLIFYWGYWDKFTVVFVSFNKDFGYISLTNGMSFINWSNKRVFCLSWRANGVIKMSLFYIDI